MLSPAEPAHQRHRSPLFGPTDPTWLRRPGAIVQSPPECPALRVNRGLHRPLVAVPYLSQRPLAVGDARDEPEAHRFTARPGHAGHMLQAVAGTGRGSLDGTLGRPGAAVQGLDQRVRERGS